MTYILKSVTIRSRNTAEQLAQLSELWNDIANGKLPILFDSKQTFQQGLSPISHYSNYESDETGEFDLSIMTVKPGFFIELDKKVKAGEYKKFDVSDDNNDLQSCTYKAWSQVWNEQKTNIINRAFTSDYESSVPKEYTKDGKAHCYLWIAITTNK